MSGAVVVNTGGWNASSDDQLIYNGGNGPSFTNNGTLRKSGGAGATTINATVGFVNNGSINAQTGSISFTGGSLFNAGSVFSGAGAVSMVSGTNSFAGGTFALRLQSLAIHDVFNITGTAALGGTLALSCYATCSLSGGDVVTILDSDGDISGSFASVTLNGFASGAFSVIYDTAADRVQLLVTQNVTAAVPEPGSAAMLLAGLAAMGAVVRRRR